MDTRKQLVGLLTYLVSLAQNFFRQIFSSMTTSNVFSDDDLGDHAFGSADLEDALEAANSVSDHVVKIPHYTKAPPLQSLCEIVYLEGRKCIVHEHAHVYQNMRMSIDCMDRHPIGGLQDLLDRTEMKNICEDNSKEDLEGGEPCAGPSTDRCKVQKWPHTAVFNFDRNSVGSLDDLVSVFNYEEKQFRLRGCILCNDSHYQVLILGNKDGWMM